MINEKDVGYTSFLFVISIKESLAMNRGVGVPLREKHSDAF